jgi:phosphoribosyl-AMP cyclohydrolase / phosphoribosyl-ATP pyrophosphohydrolase
VENSDYHAAMAVRPEELRYNEHGLLPAIAQDRLTGEVRMLAWMDRHAVEQTLKTRRATFFSRSRGKAWVKGEESGNYLEVVDVQADCDGDTLLLLCDPAGPSCHTGARNCFFEPLLAEPKSEGAPPPAPALPFLAKLEAVISERGSSSAEKSYTKSLLSAGAHKVGEKLREEAGELAEAVAQESPERVASEAGDLLFHMLVGLRLREVAFRDVLAVLARRFGQSGHVEKASRKSDPSGGGAA